MSEPIPTPRTDAVIPNPDEWWVHADFARTLERELNTERAAREQCELKMASWMSMSSVVLNELEHGGTSVSHAIVASKLRALFESTTPPPLLAERDALKARLDKAVEIIEASGASQCTCDHKWIGNICTNCGVAYHIWTEHELERLRAESAGNAHQSQCNAQSSDNWRMECASLQKQAEVNHLALGVCIEQRDALKLKLEVARDGNWIDKWGACKVCDGEIPQGHTNNCDLFKIEQQRTLLKTALSHYTKATFEETSLHPPFHKRQVDNGAIAREALSQLNEST